MDTIIKFINGLATAIDVKGPQLKAAVSKLITAIINFLNPMTVKFREVGKNIIKALAAGMGAAVGEATKAAKAAAQKIVGTVKDVFGIDSPSKVFKGIGINTGEGMIMGLKSIGSKVNSAATNMAEGSSNAMSKGLEGVRKLLSSDMELQPTLRPVVDMTDVQNGIDNTFKKQQSVDISASKAKVAAVVPSTKVAVEASKVGLRPPDTKPTSITVTNNYSVRSDLDIRKISKDLNSVLERHTLAKGVTA